MQERTSHNQWHEPEPPNNVLLIRLAVKFNISHVVKRDQVKNYGRDAGDGKPTSRTRATTERDGAGHYKANQQRPLMEKPENKVMKTFQQTAIDTVVSSEPERAVLLPQHMPARNRHTNKVCFWRQCCEAHFLNPAKVFELPQLTYEL